MTKILAILGSPRPKGNNNFLMNEAVRGATACEDVHVQKILLNELNIKPCQHCDGCLHTGRCVIRDDMDAIYQAIPDADAIILATPIYFSGLSAQTKLMIDRCQPFWSAKYVLKTDLFAGKHRPAMLIVTGGQPAYDSQFVGSLHVVHLWYRMIGVKSIGNLTLSNTYALPAPKRTDDLAQAFALGRQLIAKQEK